MWNEPIQQQSLFCFSDFSLAAATSGQQFGSLPSAAAAAIAAQAAQQAVAACPVSVGGGPGKARSSMSLQLLSGR